MRNFDEIVEKMDEIRVEGNQRWGGGRLKKKWMKFIRDYMRACGVGEDIVC